MGILRTIPAKQRQDEKQCRNDDEPTADPENPRREPRQQPRAEQRDQWQQPVGMCQRHEGNPRFSVGFSCGVDAGRYAVLAVTKVRQRDADRNG